MNIEKMVNSKFYRVFEWSYRLIFINLLTLIVSCSLAAIPFLFYYLLTKDGLLVILGLVLFIILFVPAAITAFVVLKHYMGEQTGNVFVLYFRYLIDTIKRTYVAEIILLPFFFLSLFGLWFYGSYLSQEGFMYDFYGITAIVFFVVIFFLLVSLVLVFINLMLIVAYFRMKPLHYIRLALKFSMRYMGQTIIYGLVLLLPFVLLNFFVMEFRPIYLLIGISLPQLVIALMTKTKLSYLVRNLSN